MSNAQSVALIACVCLTIALLFLVQTIWITHFLGFGWRREEADTEELPVAPRRPLG